MSIESVKKLFIEKMKTDKEFAKKIAECKNAEARMAIVKVAGYDFTPHEIEELVSVLSDDELSQVTGGGEATEVQVRNDLTKGAINASIFKDGKLL